MKSHASMNRIYRLVWNQLTNAWVAVAETARGRGKGSSRKLIAAALSLTAVAALAGPEGGQVVSGSGSISQSGATTTIAQTSQNLSLTWQSFNVAAQETVNFVQPSASAIAVNRIFDTNASHILGHFNANGQVYLINPNGILFGQGAQVNVGGLVASTLDLSDASLSSHTRSFSGKGTGSVINMGTINATGSGIGTEGGYVALLGNTVSNQGTITAPGGTVALGSGSAATLTFQNNSLVSLQIDQSTLNNLAENQQLIRADGGTVLMSAGAKDALLASVVNNTGVIEARTVENHEGTIVLLGGMRAGTVHVGGTLDASAPSSAKGGNGGFIETSAAHVKVADGAKVSTLATHGKTGTWLIDPTDFTISSGSGAQTGSGIGATTLASNLASSNITLSTDNSSGTDSGDIHVNAAVNWSANKLTLNAYNNININANLNGSGTASLALLYGQGTTSGGTSNYNIKAEVNLAAGNNFSTQLGSAGPLINYTVITSLGAQGSSTAADLQGINAGLSGNYALGANIDAAGTASWNAGAGFAPIGTSGALFTGIFDGLGHSIANLNINRPSANNVGLFGAIGAASVIRNVGLVGGSVTGKGSVGMLVGFSYGSISNSYATGNVDGTSGDVGGLVGDNVGSIGNSYASGNVSGQYSVGGLVGYNNGTISNAYATGAVNGYQVGGLVGSNYGGYINNAYASGSVSGGAAGGLVGASAPGRTSGVTNSFWDATTTGQATSVGGGTGLTTVQMHSVSTFAPWSISANGGEATTWRIYEGQTNPLLRSFLTPLSLVDTTVTYNGSTQSGTTSSLGGVLGSAAAGRNAGAYLSGYSSTQQGYDISGGGMTIDKLALTGSITSGTSTYGNSLTAGTVVFNNLVSGDDVAAAGTVTVNTSGNTSSSGHLNAGSYTGIESVGSTLSGTDAGNYSFAGAVGDYTVNKLALTGAITAGTSTYGDALSPGVASFSNLVGSDVVTTGSVTVNTSGNTSTSGHLNAGSYTGVQTLTSIGGADAGNYSYAGVVGDYTVSQLALTGTIGPGSSTYGSALSTGNASFSNLVGTDVVTTGTVAVNTSGNTSTSGHLKAGSYTGVQSLNSVSGADAGNYSHAAVAGDYTVSQLALTGSITTGTSTYGSAFTTGTASLGNAVSGDAVAAAGTVSINTSGNTSSSGNLKAGSHSGIQSVDGTLSGTDAGNYSFAGAVGDYTVNALSLNVSGLAASHKVYDANTSATLGGTAAVTALTGDNVTLGGTASGAFDTRNVGTGKTVTLSGLTLGGLDAGNYVLTSNVTADTTQADLSVSGLTASSKVYDGSTTATLGGAATVTALGSDSVTLGGTASGAFDTKDAGMARTVTVTGNTLSGTDAGNYKLLQQTGLSADITLAPLIITANDASKTYDAVAYSGGNGVRYTGLAGGDTATALAGTLGYGGTSQGALNTGSYTLTPGGLSSGNYTVSFVDGSLTISPAPVVLSPISLSGSRVYDGTVNVAAGIFTLGGLVAGQDLSLTGVGTVADKNVGNNKPVTLGSLALGNGSTGLASNYSLSGGTSVASITPAPLTITADQQFKVFASVDPQLSFGTGALAGSDTLASAFSGSLARSAGEATGEYSINQGSLSSVAGNYTLSFTPGSLRIVPRVQGGGAGSNVVAVAVAPTQAGESSNPAAPSWLTTAHALQQESPQRAEQERRALAIVIVDEGIRLPAGLAQ